MAMKKLADVSIFNKIIGTSIGTLFITTMVVMFYMVPLMKADMEKQKREKTRNLVEVAYSILEDFNNQASSGKISMDMAKKMAAAHIEKFRYNESDYFWINDLGPTMIMHPIAPKLNGQDLSGKKDENGKYLFVEFVAISKSAGGGFVDYLWPKPGMDKPVEKVSYVKLFKPWGWIVGSGIYIDDINKEIGGMRVKVLVAMLSIIGILLFFIIRISRSITAPIQKCVDMAAEIESGNLNFTIEIGGQDEVGVLAGVLVSMSKKLRGIVSQINEKTNTVATGSNNVSASSGALSGGIQQQVQKIEQSAAAATEMSQTIINVAGNAAEASGAAKESVQVANEGKLVVDQTVTGMQSIAHSVETSARTIEALGESSKQIGEIINVIKDIADQTNLLALNAAIEAARAGEQGRGFAVVADEVRKLAERTGKATQEISDMINKIQKDTEHSVQSMAEGKGKADEGVELAEKSKESLDKIVEASQRCLDMVQMIATATEEQSTAIEEVSTAMESIAEVSRNSENSVSEITISTENLAKTAYDLKELVGWFRIEPVKTGSQQAQSRRLASGHTANTR
ncbi:MAG: methyl-accepting chemotaxis protein [Nitrospira sp.]|nr:methyl-accepting chemotaxis protein [Nitrospira sp.]